MATWTFEELTVFGDSDEPHTFNVEFDFKCTFRGAPATPPSYASGGEPPDPAEWELEEIRLVNPAMNPVVMNEDQFTTVFPDGDDILTNAYEWAHEQDPHEEGDTT